MFLELALVDITNICRNFYDGRDARENVYLVKDVYLIILEMFIYTSIVLHNPSGYPVH